MTLDSRKNVHTSLPMNRTPSHIYFYTRRNIKYKLWLRGSSQSNNITRKWTEGFKEKQKQATAEQKNQFSVAN